MKQTRLLYLVAGAVCCLVAIGLIVVLTAKPEPKTETKTKPADTVVDLSKLPDGEQNGQSEGTPLSEVDLVLGAVHGYQNEATLVAIPSEYTTKQELVHADVLSPLLAMMDAASKDGIDLTVVSAYRSYDRQKRIWEGKWGESDGNDIAKAQDILRYSSFPGTSRHHWGTDVDFNSVSLSYWQSAEGERIFAWLQDNAPRFGFCQVYGKGRKSGYEVEAWHWSHLPTAESYYQKISQFPVLNVALEQPVNGAAAVRELAPQMMNYVININTCAVE